MMPESNRPTPGINNHEIQNVTDAATSESPAHFEPITVPTRSLFFHTMHSNQIPAWAGTDVRFYRIPGFINLR